MIKILNFINKNYIMLLMLKSKIELKRKGERRKSRISHY